jgi:hypothetical protein
MESWAKTQVKATKQTPFASLKTWARKCSVKMQYFSFFPSSFKYI